MNELSKKKQFLDNTVEKPFYNINSFRGLYPDKSKQSNEIKINKDNLTSRIVLEINNKLCDKSRTTSKNKIIANKILSAATNEKIKHNTKSILEISYNIKSSPKKLFAETSKKHNYVHSHYRNTVTNTNPNAYITCLTDDNEINVPNYEAKVDQSIKKFIYSEKNNNRIQRPGVFFNRGNNETLNEKTKLNFNYKKQNIQIRPIAINSALSSRRELISPTKRDTENTTKHYLNTNNEKLESSLLHNNSNVSKTHESFLPKVKKNLNEEDERNNVNLLSEFNNQHEFALSQNAEIPRKVKIKLEDGISLNIVKSHGEKRIKKFLHIPDFEIYIIKEIPLDSKMQSVNVSEKIKEWNSKMSKSSNFVKIHREVVNNPEGYVSLVYEYMEGFSLGDLIENFGTLSENLLQKITCSLLNCLAEYEENFSEDFGDICPCNILFDKYGNLKLSPRLFNCCKKEVDPLNPENKQVNNFFNKCICYDFFHNSIRNKIRFILREITNPLQTNPSNNTNINKVDEINKDADGDVEAEVEVEEEDKQTNKIHKASSFPKDKYKYQDSLNSNTNRLTNSNPKFKESSNNSAQKNSGNNYYLETHEDKINKNSDFAKKFEIKKLRSKLKENLKIARKERIINLYTEVSANTNSNTKSKDNVVNLSMKRSSSQKNKKINKENLNNYFISEKIIKTKLNFDVDKILVKEFDGNANNNNNKTNDFFSSKKEIKSTENSKGFSNYTSNGDTGNYFNRKSSVNTNSIGRLNTNDTNKFLSNNSNGMSELNKFNSNSGNPTQIIMNTENNYNSPDDNTTNNNNENFNFNKISLLNNANSKSKLISINSKVKPNSENRNNNSKNNNNISNNPNISIFNNFIFSLNKKTNAKSSSSNLINMSKYTTNENNNNNNNNINNPNPNNVKELNQKEIQSPINNSNNNNNQSNNLNSNQNTNNNFHPQSSTKDFNSSDNYFTAHITKTEANNTNLQNFNSNGSSKRFDTQANLDSNAFSNEKTLRNNKNESEPLKVLHLESEKMVKSIKAANYDYPKQYFSIGYLFITLVCKSIKLKVFEFLDNFSLTNLDEVKNFNLKKCCLYHCLVSIEDGLKINKKFSIENFFSYYSENFKNFICNMTTISLSNRHKTKKRCLKGNHIYSLNAKSLKEHPWIKNENNFSNKILSSNISSMKLTMKEVIKIVRESFKTSLVEFNERKYENVLNKLEVILTNHKHVLKEENIRNALATKQKIIKKLSCDIGVNYQDFYEKVCALVDKIFA